MAAITRIGDINTGHDACPPVSLATGSGNVLVNGRGVGRVGDVYNSHSCVAHPTHAGSISAGSTSVFVNSKPVARVGDAVSCGGTAATGSRDVFIGG